MVGQGYEPPLDSSTLNGKQRAAMDEAGTKFTMGVPSGFNTRVPASCSPYE